MDLQAQLGLAAASHKISMYILEHGNCMGVLLWIRFLGKAILPGHIVAIFSFCTEDWKYVVDIVSTSRLLGRGCK